MSDQNGQFSPYIIKPTLHLTAGPQYILMAQSVRAVEYTECFSAEG